MRIYYIPNEFSHTSNHYHILRIKKKGNARSNREHQDKIWKSSIIKGDFQIFTNYKLAIYKCTIVTTFYWTNAPLNKVVTLFVIFIDQLESFIQERTHAEDDCLLHHTLMSIFLFVDDVILLASTLEGLQCYLNELAAFCTLRQMTMNISKTKVIVFNTTKESLPSSLVLWGSLPSSRGGK